MQIFDGVSGQLFAGHVLIEGRTIAAVDTSPIAAGPETVTIDGAGRVLMPGMTDAHVHLVGMANTMADLIMATQTRLAAATLGHRRQEHACALMLNSTDIRDVLESLIDQSNR